MGLTFAVDVCMELRAQGYLSTNGMRYEVLGWMVVCPCVWQLHVGLEPTDISVRSLLETCLTNVSRQHGGGGGEVTCALSFHPSLPASQNSREESS